MGAANKCEHCHEDVSIMKLDGQFFSRPQRFSKCRFYTPPAKRVKATVRPICHSPMCPTEAVALATFPHGSGFAPVGQENEIATGWRTVEAILGTVDHAGAIEDESRLPGFIAHKTSLIVAQLSTTREQLEDAERLAVRWREKYDGAACQIAVVMVERDELRSQLEELSVENAELSRRQQFTAEEVGEALGIDDLPQELSTTREQLAEANARIANMDVYDGERGD